MRLNKLTATIRLWISALFLIQILFYLCIRVVLDEKSFNSSFHASRALGISRNDDDAALLAKITPQYKEEEHVSACLLIRDDNHFLIEWIAYHYHVAKLRHLVITIDPNSLTSPTRILNRWSNLMTIEEWNQSHYVPHDFESHFVNVSSGLSYRMKQHRARQQLFNLECLKHLKLLNKGWTMSKFQ